ncbi:MAG TPA: preprotein translocase subunit SecG [Hyphomicrobiaceae bacterium]|nr:preprotein translocase subunit SecG [Hyphomicrobiaceae bacterium]
MLTVLLVVHVMIAAALVAVVLLQRSEGGALGMGGGGGGFLTGRGTANLLTRATAALAVCFFATSLLLTILGHRPVPTGSVFDRAAEPAPASAPASEGAVKPAEPGPAPAGETPRGGILDKLK